MPSTRELAAALRVSRATVATAYDQLMAEGYLDAQHGSGTFVCRDLPDVAVRTTATARPRRTRAQHRRRACRPSRRRLAPVTWRRARRPARHQPLHRRARPSISFRSTSGNAWCGVICRRWARACSSTPRTAPAIPALRETLAAYLGRSRAVRCTPIRSSSSADRSRRSTSARACWSIRATRWPSRTPATSGARELFAASGARVRPVPVDARRPRGVGAAAGGAARLHHAVAPVPARRLDVAGAAARARRVGARPRRGRSSRTTTTASTATAARRCRRCRGSAPRRASSTSARSPT